MVENCHLPISNIANNCLLTYALPVLTFLVVYRMPAAGKLSLEDSVPAATK